MLTRLLIDISRFTSTFLFFYLTFISQNVSSLAPVKSNFHQNMVKIKGGAFIPFYNLDKDGRRISTILANFYMDVAPVTNAEFYAFTLENPRWSKSKIKKIFAEPSYLRHWDVLPDQSKEEQPIHLNLQPVRFVSWFAASAYCASVGKELPSILQWEYVAAADEEVKDATQKEEYRQQILRWYSQPSTQNLPNVRSGRPNYFGLHDLHGMVWEWNLDYNTAMVTGESREDTSLNRAFFCGSGSLNQAATRQPKDKYFEHISPSRR